MARRTQSSRRRRLVRHASRSRIVRLRGESLEQRLVLSTTVANDTDPLTAAQTSALVQGIDVLAQRLTQIQTSGLFGDEAAGLGESIGTLSPIGDQLRTGLAERLASLSGAITVLDVKNAFLNAATADPVLAISTVTATVETGLTDQTRLWFAVPITGSTSLPDYTLNLGQAPATTGSPSLFDQGLKLGDVKAAVSVGYQGTLEFGIDLAPGLTTDQSFYLKFSGLDVVATATATGASAVQDVEANFGIIKLGPADLDVSLDTRVRIDLQEGSDGVVALGELDGTAVADLGSLFSLSAAGTGLSVRVPFTQNLGGLQQAVGSAQEIFIKATDLFDPSSLSLTLPSLKLADGITAFDFTKLADITASDVGAFLADLGRWVPELGRGFDLPLIDTSLAALFGEGLLGDLDDLLDSLKDSSGNWSFDTIDEAISLLAAELGVATTSFELGWNSTTDAIEWKLPLSFALSESVAFDSGKIVPASLPLDVSGRGSATVDLAAAFTITAGVAVRSSAGLTTLTSASLLSSLNGGAGLTSNALVTGNDLEFRLRNGTTLGFDLDGLSGLGTDATPGTATIGDLLTLLNGPSATGKLQIKLTDNALVATDLTTPASKTATFSIAGPSVTVKVGTTDTVQVSLAPVALGLLAAPTTGDTIGGISLESYSPRDRIYVKEDTLASVTLKISGSLEAGAALGPLALSVYAGAVQGSAGVAIKLVDPGTGLADDGRIYLAEMNAGVGELAAFNVTSPTLDGIFQLKVRPETLASSVFGIVDANYKATPLTTVPVSADVPYLRLQAGAAGGAWTFDVSPSIKLSQALENLGDFSVDDLPALLEMFASYLVTSGLWDIEIPWDGRTLGDVLGITDVLGSLTSFDLSGILGRPTGGVWPTGSLNGLGDTFIDAIDANLPALSALPGFDRLQRLSWSLDDLMVRWEGWVPGTDGFDISFIRDLAAWAVEANLVFAAIPTTPSLDPFRLAFGRLLAFDATKDATWLSGLTLSSLNLDGLVLGGLDGFGDLIEGLFPTVPGLTVNVTPSLGTVPSSTNKALVFDMALTYTGVSTTVDLDALSVGADTAFSVTGTGSIFIKIDGTVAGRFGVNLSTAAPFFDTTNSSITLEAEIDDGAGVTLGASVGGILGISLGSTDAGKQLATVSLGNKTGTDAAQFKLSASGVMTADATFAANLPIYITGLGDPTTGEGLGALALSATLDTALPDPFAVSASFVPDVGSEVQSLADIFSTAAFNLDSWVDGVLLFINGVQTALETDLVQGLPLIGDIDLSSDGALAQLKDFFSDLKSVVTTPKALSDKLTEKISALGAGFSSSFSFTIGGVAVDSSSSNWNTNFSDFLGVSDEFIVDFIFAGATSTPLGPERIDFGLDALGLELRGANVTLDAGFTVDLGLGFSRTKGFFLKTDSGTELTASFGLSLPVSGVEMALGPLFFTLADTHAGQDLTAALTLDLPSASTSIAGLPGLFASATPGGTVEADVRVDLTASAFSVSGPGLGLSLALGYGAGGTPAGGAVSFTDLSASNFYFQITDTYIDLGGLLNGPVKEVFDRVNQMVEPLKPVLDLLTSDIPLVSDLSKLVGGSGVTFLDAIRLVSGSEYESAVTFIETMDDVVTTISSLSGIPSGKISLGGLNGKASQLLAGSGDSSAFTATATSANALLGILASPTDADAPADVKNAYADVTAGTLRFPIISNPGEQLFKFLFGGDATLVEWHLPSLNAGFELSQSFPIFPPLFATIFGGVRFTTNFTVGYDTFGLRQAMSASTFDAAKLLNGVFLDDHVTSGTDAAEMTFTATIGAGAELNVVVAKAGVKGGVEGVLGANLKDNDGDGRVHLDEFVNNLLAGPECIFDFEGALKAFFEAYIKVGLSTPFGFVTLWSDSFKLLDETIVDFNIVTCPPVEPNLFDVVASFDHDGSGSTAGVNTLVVNAGPRAGNVLPGETTDGDEEFTIDYDAATNEIVVTGYDYEERVSAAGVQAIWFDAGLGNDIVTVTATVNIPVWGFGGPGNDKLTGGRAANTLFGDSGSVAGTAGSDKLIGRKAADVLKGDAGNDVILGYGGSDVIDGGEGDDQLYGEDEVGDMVAFIAANPTFEAGVGGFDVIRGGTGSDRIVGGLVGDALYGDAGDDTIDGGAGGDSIEGGEGNDKIYGGDGDDTIWGDDIAGLLTAGAIDVNADLIEGGTGYNVIYGGPGYDTIYAADEDQKAAAPSTGTSGGWSSKLFGDDGNDTIYGTAGKDWIAGGFDSDYVESGTGDDDVFGGPGGDCLIAAGGNARIFGGHGNDVIDGGDGVNFIEGGPGDDRIYARGGADTVFGGTTGVGYAYLLEDLAQGKPVIAAIHGGFTAVTADGSCGPEVMFHPEIYPAAPHQLALTIFADLNANGIRDAGEQLAPATAIWTLRIVDKATLTDVMIVSAPGGNVVLPEVAGLPAGTYVIVVDAIPSGWAASGTASMVAEVTLGGAAPPLVPDLGFYAPGRLTGVVTTKSGVQSVPAAGVAVFLDVDKDGSLDAGEPVAVTNTAGKYTFTDLYPQAYRIAIFDALVCANVQPDFHDVALVSGGSTTSYDFEILPSVAPVVEQVLLGKPATAITWTPVPDGADQLDPLAGTFSLIAFETCIADGRVTAKSGATLLPVASNGSLGNAIPLTFLGADPTRSNRFIYQVSSITGDNSLKSGRYRFVLDDAMITSATGALLDGNWTTPSTAFPSGSQYPSGNGAAGGDFIFDFVISAIANLAAVSFGSDSWLPSPSGNADASTIQGTAWWHDMNDANLARTVHEPGLNGQVVKLKNAGGQTVATATTAPIDLDGNGTVEPAEQGAFRFTAVAAGTYTVVQEPVFPWLQATPGGGLVGETLYAVSHATQLGKNSLWTIDSATLVATKVRDFQNLVARDIAFTSRDTAWISGTSVSTSTSTPAVAGLWRMDVPTGAVASLGEVPGGQPLLSLDALDANTLLGVSKTGEVLIYRISAAAWESRGFLLTSSNGRLYPVGDAVVVAADEVYVVCIPQFSETVDVKFATAQVLIRLDTTVLGANSTLVRDFRTVSEMFVGLEQRSVGTLVAIGTGRGLYSFASSGAGGVTNLRTLVEATGFDMGGLAIAPAVTTIDSQRSDFLVSVTGGQTIDVGFGDVPNWVVLEDGDDTIDGGCGVDNDILAGDDGSGLPWYVKTIGGHDFIRGRDGDDQISGGQQGDILLGEKGNDLILGGNSAVNRLDGGDGNDSISGGPLADVINGGDGADSIQGNDGGDTIFGDAGDDVIWGNAGDDTIVAGAGQDLVYGDEGDDVLYVLDTVLGGSFAANPGSFADVYDGGMGTDTLVVRADINTTLQAAKVIVFGTGHSVFGVEAALLTGGVSANVINATAFTGTTVIRGLGGNDTLDGGTSSDLIFGDKGNDTLRGNTGNDDLRGGQDDDVIDGNAGTDTIRGGAGSNTLTGGADSDTFIFEGVFDDRVIELAAGGGSDTIDMTAITASLVATIDAAASGTRIYASSPMLAVEWVNDQVERVLLGSGDDIVYLKKTGSTAARIDAGIGQDLLSYGNDGNEWVSAVTVSLLTGTATGVAGGIAGFEDLTGGDGGDTLTGDAGPNTIFGGAGGDVISGNAGNDVLYGEDGNDQISGGADADMLSGGGGTNTLAGGLGDDTYAFYAAGASDTVNEAAGQGTDVLDYAYVYGSGIDATVSGTIAVTYGTSTTSVATAAGIDRIRGTSEVDRFRVADAAAFGGILDGYGIPGYAFTDMDVLDLSAWTTPVTVSYLGALDASFVGSATGTGGVVNLRHVIGGTKNDILRAGGLPVWFEGRAGDDTLAGSIQDDLLDGGNDADTITGSFGNDVIKGGWGSDTLAGGYGNDTYSFFDLFGTDTIIENPGEGNDTMDFSAVLTALTVSLGSVTVTAPGASATHAGTAIERVVGGAGNDTFVMTGPSVTFPGTLDGGGGTNTLRYDNATPAIVAQVNNGQAPNVGYWLKFDSITAVPAYTPVTLTVPSLSTVTDTTTRSGNQRIVKQGAGKLILSLANTHTEGTAVEAGELVVKNVSALGTGGLEIAAGAKASLDIGLASIKLGFIKFDGLFDIDRATLTVASGLSRASLVAGIAAGRGDGSWNGANGITSGVAAGSGGTRTIGWLDNGDGSFTVGYTAPGDTNLDGQVDVLDAANILMAGGIDAGLAGTWNAGDFNYDSVIDVLDIADFIGQGLFNAGPLDSQSPAATNAIATSTLSNVDLAFAAFAQDQPSQAAPRRKNIFAAI